MPYMKSAAGCWSPLAWVVMAASLACSSAWAETPAVIQASSSITQFGYELTDLTPNDGVAAAVNFVQGTYGGQVLRPDTDGRIFARGMAPNPPILWPDNGGVQRAFSGPVPGQVVGVVSEDGTNSAHASPEGLSAETHVRLIQEGMLTPEGQVVALPNDGAQFRATASSAMTLAGWELAVLGSWQNPETGKVSVYGVAPEFASAHNFVLAPHTSITFRGSMNLALSVAEGLVDPFANDGARLSVNAAISVGRQAPTHPLATEYESREAFMSAVLGAYDVDQDELNALYGMGSLEEGVKSKDFAVTFTNDGDNWLKGTFEMGVSSKLVLPSPVPEPGTYALMGIGLAALIWRCRTAQRQA